jgi:transcriptional regulator with XRE-family HTH domain
MAKAKQHAAMTVSESLRSAMADCGMTRYQLSKQTGINQSALGRFFKRERDLQLETVDVLAEVLGLELVKRKQKA